MLSFFFTFFTIFTSGFIYRVTHFRPCFIMLINSAKFEVVSITFVNKIRTNQGKKFWDVFLSKSVFSYFKTKKKKKSSDGH